mgnify:CR=1 FL=1
MNGTPCSGPRDVPAAVGPAQVQATIPGAGEVQLPPADEANLVAHLLAEAMPTYLGNAALRTLAASFAVTPLQTLFGWRWHLVLRRDFGRWAFAFAVLDLVIAGADAKGDVISGIGGQNARDQMQKRRFPRPAFATQCQLLTGLERKLGHINNSLPPAIRRNKGFF